MSLECSPYVAVLCYFALNSPCACIWGEPNEDTSLLGSLPSMYPTLSSSMNRTPSNLSTHVQHHPIKKSSKFCCKSQSLGDPFSHRKFLLEKFHAKDPLLRPALFMGCIYQNNCFAFKNKPARLGMWQSRRWIISMVTNIFPAQSVERQTLISRSNLKVAGSTPALGSIPSAQA